MVARGSTVRRAELDVISWGNTVSCIRLCAAQKAEQLLLRSRACARVERARI